MKLLSNVEIPEEIQEDINSSNDKVIELEPWKRQLMKTKDGESIKSTSPNNVRLILENDSNIKGLFKYNEFLQELEFTNIKNKYIHPVVEGVVDDNVIDQIQIYIEQKYRYTPSKEAIRTGLNIYSIERGYNPVIEKIEAVKWDGVSRVDTFFIDYLGVDNSKYSKEVTRTWFAGMIARLYKPGIKFDLLPIIQGRQGMGKSALLRTISMGYFIDNFKKPDNKDDILKLRKALVIEFAELNAMKDNQIDIIKGFVTQQTDTVRDPFAKTTIDRKRNFVFIGTTNNKEFLIDRTGNRRYPPLLCSQEPIKNPFKLSDDERVQVLAEAKHIYDNGQKLYLSDEIQSQMVKIQAGVTVVDPAEETIKSYLDMLVPKEWQNYTRFQKRNYFDKYMEHGEYHDKNANTLNENELTPIDYVPTQEILKVVFNVPDNQLLSASRGKESKKISEIIGALENWESTTNGKTRGYKRTC